MVPHGVFDEQRQVFIVPECWLDEDEAVRAALSSDCPIYVSHAPDMKPVWPATPLRKWLAARDAAKLAIFHAQHR